MEYKPIKAGEEIKAGQLIYIQEDGNAYPVKPTVDIQELRDDIDDVPYQDAAERLLAACDELESLRGIKCLLVQAAGASRGEFDGYIDAAIQAALDA